MRPGQGGSTIYSRRNVNRRGSRTHAPASFDRGGYMAERAALDLDGAALLPDDHGGRVEGVQRLTLLGLKLTLYTPCLGVFFRYTRY